MIKAYVLCGGFGTRLRTVIHNSQKAMVNIHGKPFLSHILRQLAAAGVQEVVLCAHYRADQLAEQLEVMSVESGLIIHMVIEPEPMGTGGALLNALRIFPPEGRYLVLNADTFVESEAYCIARQAAGNILIAVQVEDRQRYGALAIGYDGYLQGLHEKKMAGSGLVSAGLYAFMPDAFSAFPVEACSMEQVLLPALLRQASIRVLAYGGQFIDIGTPESLEQYMNEFGMDG